LTLSRAAEPLQQIWKQLAVKKSHPVLVIYRCQGAKPRQRTRRPPIQIARTEKNHTIVAHITKKAAVYFPPSAVNGFGNHVFNYLSFTGEPFPCRRPGLCFYLRQIGMLVEPAGEMCLRRVFP
jgi:hypothetical protein